MERIKDRNIKLRSDYNKLSINIEFVEIELKNHNWISVGSLSDILMEENSFNLILFYDAITYLSQIKKLFIRNKNNKRYITSSESLFNETRCDLASKIIKILQNGHLRIDAISALLNISTTKIRNILLNLEQNNIINSFLKKGKYYQLV